MDYDISFLRPMPAIPLLSRMLITTVFPFYWFKGEKSGYVIFELKLQSQYSIFMVLLTLAVKAVFKSLKVYFYWKGVHYTFIFLIKTFNF